MRVLVVDADIASAEFLGGMLRRYGYDVNNVDTGKKALKGYHHADLVLLNAELPDLDGLDVCRAIRAACDTPIIYIAANATELDRVIGLRAGSDDYLVEPYGFRELIARIEAIMRRVRPRRATKEPISRGPLNIDLGTREVRVNNRAVSVTRKEFDLLFLLASQPEVVVPREQIIARVWDGSYANSSRTLDTHVSSLRNKLGARSWIITVRGVGFRLGYG